MKKFLVIAVKEPGEKIGLKKISNSLYELQLAVGGNIEYISTADKELEKRSIFIYGDEEAKLRGCPQPNFWLYDKQDCFCGNAVFCKDNGEGGEEDITQEDLCYIEEFLEKVKLF